MGRTAATVSIKASNIFRLWVWRKQHHGLYVRRVQTQTRRNMKPKMIMQLHSNIQRAPTTLSLCTSSSDQNSFSIPVKQEEEKESNLKITTENLSFAVRGGNSCAKKKILLVSKRCVKAKAAQDSLTI